jgi:DNA-binding NtrC family response regulator
MSGPLHKTHPMKPFFTSSEHRFASIIARLSHCNHFLPERIALEREALGEEFHAAGSEWNLGFAEAEVHPNPARLAEKTAALVNALAARARPTMKIAENDLVLYEDLVAYHLYHAHRVGFLTLARGGGSGTSALYKRFSQDLVRYVEPVRRRPVDEEEMILAFALLHQIRRGFLAIFSHLIGHSPAMVRLRASVWESIFTHDLRRYRKGLYQRMAGLATLITGPSGSGKELVARAIAHAGFVPFDASAGRFVREMSELYLPLNLAAFAPTLIESELFGHRRGAFTGATTDRAGWLEVCPPEGTVFLDEIGETSPAIQVKLLRLLQTREFQRLGENSPRRFTSRIIAATSRDLPREIREGRFRGDFYYRLCSDRIVTPSLHEQLRKSPDDLAILVRFIARDLCDPDEAERLVQEVLAWIERHLPAEYSWPGNFRELEQCTRSILIRGRYEPLDHGPDDGAEDLWTLIRSGQLTAEQLLERYCALVHQQTGSIEQTARRLDLDRRTVRARLRSVREERGGNEN